MQEPPVLNRAKASKVVLSEICFICLCFSAYAFFLLCLCYACHFACCADVDECSEPTLNACDITQNCINTFGSYICICKDGYTSNGLICEGMIWFEKHCTGASHCASLLSLFKGFDMGSGNESDISLTMP